MIEDNSNAKEGSAVASLTDTNRKIEAALIPAIEEHVTSSDFDASKDGLDFLNVKNTMMISYLIDLTYRIRQDIISSPTDESGNDKNLERLTEMKTALDKTRPMEKKMHYQLNKLLTTSTSSTFASAGGGTEDPLQFRPNLKAFQSAEDGSASEDESDSFGSNGESGEEDDAELAAAKVTVARARIKSKATNDKNDETGGLYRAPRMTSMPYPLDGGQDDMERKRRVDRRLQTSELVQTLRHQYGETPEQEDVHGASDFGKQREAARRMAQREAEKIQFEEDTMVRLTTSRKEKKDRKRLMREESSNLNAISDLGNLVRGVSSAFNVDNQSDDDGAGGDGLATERYDNGKRRRSTIDPVTGQSTETKRKRGTGARNSLQAALYGGGKDKKSKKSKRRSK